MRWRKCSWPSIGGASGLRCPNTLVEQSVGCRRSHGFCRASPSRGASPNTCPHLPLARLDSIAIAAVSRMPRRFRNAVSKHVPVQIRQIAWPAIPTSDRPVLLLHRLVEPIAPVFEAESDARPLGRRPRRAGAIRLAVRSVWRVRIAPSLLPRCVRGVADAGLQRSADWNAAAKSSGRSGRPGPSGRPIADNGSCNRNG
jgi:hypothetical protein